MFLDNIIMLIAIIGETHLISKQLYMVVKRTDMQGGNVLHGAMMGLLSAGAGEGLMAQGGSLKTAAKLTVQSVIGGALNELGGGNFANGAITATFSLLFNLQCMKRNCESRK